jgi:hypothetical protein
LRLCIVVSTTVFIPAPAAASTKMPLSESVSGTVACRNRDYQIILLLFEFNGLIVTVALYAQNIHSTASCRWLKVDKIITVLCLV